MNPWKPIESAPKDRPILVCVFTQNLGAYGATYCPQTAFWASYHPNAKGKPTWRTAPSLGNILNPTHWMELPEPPEGI